MMTKPINRKWIIWTLKEFHPRNEKRKSKRPRRLFADVIAEVQHDESVLKLFEYAGTDYRDPGAWYPLIGLLAELVAPDAIQPPRKAGRRKFWTDEEGRLLLQRYDEYQSRYAGWGVKRIFMKMQKDHPDWYPPRTLTDHSQTEVERRKSKATTLERQRRIFLSA
jgi:hypothetical protein